MIERFLRRPHGAGEITADLLRVVGLVSVVVAGIWWQWTDAGVLAAALPVLLVPRFVGVRPAFDIVYCITVLVSAWSNVFDLYTSVAGWDLWVHTIATGVIAITVYLLLARLRVVAAPGTDAFTPRVPIVLVTAIGLAISALWEFVEWFGWAFITDGIFVAYEDTIGDMAVGALGALAAGILLAFVRLDRD